MNKNWTKIYVFLLTALVTFVATGANYSRMDDLIIKSTASVGSNTTPNSKSVLDLTSTTLGFLEPRQTTTQRDAITSPTEGLQIYNSTTHYPNYYNASAWLQLASLTGTEALTNKTIGNTNTCTIKDTLFTLQDDGDATKLMAWQLSGITTGNTRTLTMADHNVSLAAFLRADVATGSANHVVINDGSGVLSSEATLAVSRGGTGLASGTSGGVLAYTASGTLASSGALTASQLIKGGGAGVAPSTFAACTDGQVLKWASGIPACGSDSTGAGSLTYRSVTTTDTATTADDVLVLSGATFTETLYTAVGNANKVITIKHGGTSVTQVYTVDPNGAETIEDDSSHSTFLLYTKGEEIRLISNGANWELIDHKTRTGFLGGAVLTVTGTSTNPTKATTQQVDQIDWFRDGHFAVVRIQYQQDSGSGGAAGTGGEYQILLPSALVADVTQATGALVNTENNINKPGRGTLESNFRMDNTSTTGLMQAVLFDSTHLVIYGYTGSDVVWGSGTFTLAGVLKFYGTARVPIAGWNP